MISRVSIVLLVIALITLAALQYHWIGQISEASSRRLEASVKDSSTRFAGDFIGEIRSMSTSLDFRGYEPVPAAIAALSKLGGNLRLSRPGANSVCCAV